MLTLQQRNVSGLFLRGYLAGLRKVTGGRYASVLEQAGLEKYRQHYPAETFDPAANGQQFVRLNEVVREVLDPSLYDLFSRNLGREFAHIVVTLPLLQQATQEAGPLSNSDNLRRLFAVIADLNNRSIDQLIAVQEASNPIATPYLQKYPQAIVVRFQDCIFCYGRKDVTEPCCHVIVAYFKELLLLLSRLGGNSTRFQVEEIHCAAASQTSDCYFLIRRAAATTGLSLPSNNR